MKDIQLRIRTLIKDSGLTMSEFANRIDMHQSSLSRALTDGNNIGDATLNKISIAFGINKSWLLTGEGDMFKEAGGHVSITLNADKKERNLIPFYDNVSTIGGLVGKTSDVDTIHPEPSEYIDTGDWFRDATAAMRHYEDSMDEYPSGCILALKEVVDRELVVPGRDYVIETSEYRVTKRVQRGKTQGYITAYSTNKETYPDGRMIHEPFDIPWKAIRRISLVLGYVVKKNGGTIVFSNDR